MHRELAVQYFNSTWDLIDKKDRTPEDTLNMIHMAHASRFHWGHAGTALEWSRGEWQLSRVYALANLGQSALFHGEHALNYCTQHNIGDFDLAFAYEAIARAHAVLNHPTEAKKYVDLAHKAAQFIAKEDDKDYLLSELNTIRLD